MTADICNILLSYIDGLPWFEKYTGLVKRVTYKELVEGRFIDKSFPVGCDVEYQACLANPKRFQDFAPNSKHKSIHYFESVTEVRQLSADYDYTNYEVTVRLVGWLNLKKMGKKDMCSASSLAVLNIKKLIPKTRVNNGMYSKVFIQSVGEAIKDPRIFNGYSYDETTTQYLMHPFDYYAMDFRVQFSVHDSCVPDLNLDPEQC